MLAFGSLSAAAAPHKHVLLLHSFGREFAPFNTVSETFRTELGQQLGDRVEFHDVALESARFEDGAPECPLVDYLTALFASRRLDLVVTIGGPAARFGQKYRPRLFPSTPMLIAAVDERLLQTVACPPVATAVSGGPGTGRFGNLQVGSTRTMSAEIIDNTGGILCARITGTLTHPELVALQKAASDIINRQGKARLLVVVENFQGWQRGGDWGDLSFQLAHDAHIEKMAIVGDKKWEDLALVFASKGFRSFPIEYFAAADLAKARAWLAETPR